MRELVLHCLEAQAEALSDALLEAGVLSVSVEDADFGTDDERPLFGEPGTEPDVQAWDRNRVVALLPDGADPAQIMAEAAEAGELDPALFQDWSLRDVPDADWVRLTQSQFGPIQVAERLWIVPSWHRDNPDVPGLDLDAADGAIHIELDPGLAFGTGSHPTTHLCLAWLEAELPAGATLLDYGCGSGILAIAARKLGAGPTQAVDIDPQAVQSTVFNAQVNGVELDAMLPDGLKDGTFQVVVANILSNPLKVLAPMLAGRVAPGGQLVLSGVLERQAEEVAAAYAPWIAMSVCARATAGSACTAARPERIAAAQRHGFDHPLPALRHRLQGGAGPVADPQWPGALRRLLHGVRRPGQSGAARGRSRAAGRDAGSHAGRDCGPGRRAGPCGSSLGSARDSDCPGFRAGAAVGRRACFLAIPGAALGAAAIHDAARRAAQPRTDPPAGAGPGRARRRAG